MTSIWTIAWGIVLGFFIIIIISLVIGLLSWLFFGEPISRCCQRGFKYVLVETDPSNNNAFYQMQKARQGISQSIYNNLY